MRGFIAAGIAHSFPIPFIAILTLGFFLGMRHATDADHVVAVSTIVSRERNVVNAALIGASWGTGHTLTILAVGTAIIVFGFVVSPRVGLSMELSVGLMLAVLGALNIFGVKRSVSECVHQHNALDAPHSEVAGEDQLTAHASRYDTQGMHRLSLAALDSVRRTLGIYQMWRPLLIGIIHGLAGSAAIALLVLTTIRNSRWAVAYLLIFGLGTVAGMMIVTVALASTIVYAGRRSEPLTRYLAAASGWISLALGLLIAYQIGITDGLLTNHPHWIPH